MADRGGATTVAPSVSVIVPFHRGLHMLDRVLLALWELDESLEIIVVANGSQEDLSAVPDSGEVRVLSLVTACGPAIARNRGAAVATGEILVFVDADVVPHASAIPRMVSVLSREPAVAAVFGAYDHAPADSRFYSQYRNLAHAFVHEQARSEPRTSWAGLGAIRRSAFEAVGGFDERFRRPSIEDIDLGYRLTAAGFRIRLDSTVRGTHLRGWTLRSSVVTDVRDRGVPWTQALIKYGHGAMASDANLNVSWRGRAAVTGLADRRQPRRLSRATGRAGVAAGAAAGLAWLEWPLLRRFRELRGPSFAARVFLGQLLHHGLNGVSVVVGTALWMAQRFGWRTSWTLPVDVWGREEKVKSEK